MPHKDASDLTLDEALADLPDEFGFFAERFRETIQPELQMREEARLEAVAHASQFKMYAVVVALLVGGLAAFFFQSPLGAIGGLIAGIGVWTYGGQKLRAMGGEAKMMLVDPVAREFGMDFEHRVAEPLVMARFRNMGLVPSYDRASYEDMLTGTRGDLPFEFFEAHLEERRQSTDSKGRSSTKWVTVFRGQVLAVHFAKPFQGTTRVYRDAGIFNGLIKLGQKFSRHERVALEDPVFEKAFEVYSTDQIEARYILTPDFMERLLNLEKAFHGKQLRCAFSGGEMFVAVEGENLFEAGSMRRSMDDVGRVQEILQDFAAVFVLIDAASRYTPDSLKGPSN